jgi:hypothetical protein
MTDTKLARREAGYLIKERSLPKSIVPQVAYLLESGLSPEYAGEVMDIALERTTQVGRGKNTKLKHYLAAIQKHYSQDHIASLDDNDERRETFLTRLDEVEDLREFFDQQGLATFTYDLALELVHELGSTARAQGLLEEIIDGSSSHDGDVWKSVKGIYLLKDLMEESKKVNSTPEALLAFRRGSGIFHEYDQEDLSGSD